MTLKKSLTSEMKKKRGFIYSKCQTFLKNCYGLLFREAINLYSNVILG